MRNLTSVKSTICPTKRSEGAIEKETERRRESAWRIRVSKILGVLGGKQFLKGNKEESDLIKKKFEYLMTKSNEASTMICVVLILSPRGLPAGVCMKRCSNLIHVAF